MAPLFCFGILFSISYFLLQRTPIAATLNLKLTQNPSTWAEDNLKTNLACGRLWGNDGANKGFGTRQALGFASADASLRNMTLRWLEFTRKSVAIDVNQVLNGDGYGGKSNSQDYFNCGASYGNDASVKPACSGFAYCDGVSKLANHGCAPKVQCTGGQVYYQGACQARPCANVSNTCLVNGVCASCPSCTNGNWDNQANACNPYSSNNCRVNGEENLWFNRQNHDCVFMYG